MRGAGKALALAVLLAAAAATAAEVRRESVVIPEGETTATIEGSLKGFDSVEYQIAAGVGQEMTLSLTSDNASTYYNLFAPGDVPGDSTALYIAARDGLDYTGLLTASGDYTVQVFLIRAAARRAEEAAYTLSVALTGAAPEVPGGDALVPGTKFNATGEMRCAVGAGQPMASCKFGVVREGGGTATVTVTQPGGAERTISFEAGRAVGSDLSADFSQMHRGDLTVVTVGDERYEIPDIVPQGD